jgi:hypothetical protein
MHSMEPGGVAPLMDWTNATAATPDNLVEDPGSSTALIHVPNRSAINGNPVRGECPPPMGGIWSERSFKTRRLVD